MRDMVRGQVDEKLKREAAERALQAAQEEIARLKNHNGCLPSLNAESFKAISEILRRDLEKTQNERDTALSDLAAERQRREEAEEKLITHLAWHEKVCPPQIENAEKNDRLSREGWQAERAAHAETKRELETLKDGSAIRHYQRERDEARRERDAALANHRDALADVHTETELRQRAEAELAEVRRKTLEEVRRELLADHSTYRTWSYVQLSDELHRIATLATAPKEDGNE